MFWKRQVIIDNNILLNILNQNLNNSKYDLLKKCQSITNNSYCSYIHERGKNEGLICGSISKNKSGKCYTHSRNKNNSGKKFENQNKLKIVKEIKPNKYNRIIVSIEIKELKLFNSIVKYISFCNIPLINNILFKKKIIFIFPEYIYNIIIRILYNIDNKKAILPPPNVENNQQLIINEDNMITKKYNIDGKKKKKIKKKKNKSKKVIKIDNNINVKYLKDLMQTTINTFELKVPKDEIEATLYILFKENIKLFKIYISIILSNLNMFFKNVEIDILNKIWKNNIEYIPYKKVLIYNNYNSDNIIENLFGYIRNNYELIPQDVKILWVDFDNNNIVIYNKKYIIDDSKTGIKIYNKKDNKKETPLPLDKLTVLYY